MDYNKIVISVNRFRFCFVFPYDDILVSHHTPN
jgi:hypothetical protein